MTLKTPNRVGALGASSKTGAQNTDSVRYMEPCQRCPQGRVRTITFQKLAWQLDGDRLADLRFRALGDEEQRSIETVTLRNRTPKTMFMDVNSKLQDFCYLPGGKIVYSQARADLINSDADLWQLRSNPVTGESLSAPIRLTS